MQIVLDFARGVLFYAIIFGLGVLTAWLILPMQEQGRAMLAIGGGGAIVFLTFIIVLSIMVPLK